MYEANKFTTRYRELEINYSNYYYFTNAFTEEEISLIDQLGKSTEKEKGSVTKEGVVSDYRISEIGWIAPNVGSEWLYDKVAGLVLTANQEMWGFDVWGYHDHFQYTIYHGGGGHYDWHTDVGPGMANRKISVVVQLSDPSDYTGGELEMNGGNGSIKAPKEKNTLIVFPSFLLHRVTPVLTGTRKSLVTWISGPPYR